MSDMSRLIAERLTHQKLKSLKESSALKDLFEDKEISKDKAQYILNHQLGYGEDYATVDSVRPVAGSPGIVEVEYTVDISIPHFDYETGEVTYERDVEYRTRKLNIDEDTLTEDLTLDDDPEETDQEISSAGTSVNSSKLPALFKMVDFEKGSINLDYGGGKFNNVNEYLQEKYGATNLVYDKYNRTPGHNKEVLNTIRKNGGADTVTCSNVLNVIAEESERLAVLRNCKRYLKSGGTCYITVYEGTKGKEAGTTKSGYQLNRKTAEYESEIKSVFPGAVRKGKLWVCKN